MKKLTKKSKVLIVTAAVVVVLICCAVGIPYFTVMGQLSRIQYAPLPKDPKDIGVDTQIYKEEKKDVYADYLNIMLIGVDARDPDVDSRSDSMMIATIDMKHKKIKLTSVMRDMIVTMQGHGPMQGLNQDRLGHTYQYGKGPLTVKTVNENFKTDIRNFVKVDFFGLEKIIDKVGGVEINVKKSELPVLNNYIKEVSKIVKDSNPPFVKDAGKQNLNGRQAVAYCRIRYVGNADYERTARQRAVLTALINKLTKLNPMELNAAIGELLPYVETSMDKGEIISIAKDIIAKNITKVEQLRLPLDDHVRVIYVKNTYFLGWDTAPCLEALHKFIYEEDYNPEVLK